MSGGAANSYGALIIGGGIAGASVAAHLAPHMDVALLEREPHLAMHATGRSAAMFVPSYGCPEAQALTAASKSFFKAAASEAPALFRPRPVLHVARAERAGLLARLGASPLEAAPLSGAEALALVPHLRPDTAAAAMLERRAAEIDVAGLHALYLRTARSHRAAIVAGSGETTFERSDGVWRVDCAAGRFRAPLLVNAAGAWADQVAAAAGVRPLGLTPRLRTVVLVDPPDGAATSDWPIVMAADGAFYFRPFQDQLLVTGCDETPSPPCDAAPSPLGVAMAMQRYTQATRAPDEPKVRRRWAGLRTFAPGGIPRVDWDHEAPGFFWVAGLGGFGVQASPAIGRLAASTILRGEFASPPPRTRAPWSGRTAAPHIRKEPCR